MMNKIWSELNKTMQAQIKKKDTYEAGIDTLFNLRNQFYTIDNSTESRLFRKIMILVSLGMLGASIGVYTGSAAGSLTASKWSTSQETSMSLSANFSGTTTIEDKQNEGGRQVTPERMRNTHKISGMHPRGARETADSPFRTIPHTSPLPVRAATTAECHP